MTGSSNSKSDVYSSKKKCLLKRNVEERERRLLLCTSFFSNLCNIDQYFNVKMRFFFQHRFCSDDCVLWEFLLNKKSTISFVVENRCFFCCLFVYFRECRDGNNCIDLCHQQKQWSYNQRETINWWHKLIISYFQIFCESNSFSSILCISNFYASDVGASHACTVNIMKR